MSILSRMFGNRKQPDPLDALAEPVDEEDLGLFDVDATQRPASVAFRVEQLRAHTPKPDGEAEELPEDEDPFDETVVEELAEPAELLPKAPKREELLLNLDALTPDVEAAAAAGPDEADADAAPAEGEDGAPPEAVAGEEQPAAPLEVQTIAAPKDADALSMFRSTGANSELTALTSGIEEEVAEDLLKEAREISAWLNKKDVA